MSNSKKYVIAVDLGAESGRVMRVGFDGQHLTFENTHQFPNIPVEVRGTIYWDILRLWHEVRSGIDSFAAGASSVGIDTWGVDFGLLDRDGNLLANPVHYRDKRILGMDKWVTERVPMREIYERTGIQYLSVNTIFQLASLVAARSPVLENAARLLTMPDLFHYWLSGTAVGEFTMATTTQCYNPRTCDWDWETLRALGVPTHIFPEVVQPGTRLGEYNGLAVIVPASHDTNSAVVAVPATSEDFAYLSSGTWSLLGVEVTEPIINDRAFAANYTNEGGAYGTFCFLKNVMGLWLAQECRRTWQSQGTPYTWDELVAQAAQAEPFRSLVDPDDPLFLPMGDMPARIREFCQRTGQPVPETVGQMMRTVYESLALKYRLVFDTLQELTGRTLRRLHIVGGGTKNKLLCQMAADALGVPVYAGPVEATALGNAVVQLIALGELDNIAQARELLSRSVDMAEYLPYDTAIWEDQLPRYQALVS
jgi:sugar (pentulose or hexulose) kinase